MECVGDIRKAYKILAWKIEGKREFWRLRRRCVDNIRMNLRLTEPEDVK
jgi:hypothetical protein